MISPSSVTSAKVERGSDVVIRGPLGDGTATQQSQMVLRCGTDPSSRTAGATGIGRSTLTTTRALPQHAASCISGRQPLNTDQDFRAPVVVRWRQLEQLSRPSCEPQVEVAAYRSVDLHPAGMVGRFQSNPGRAAVCTRWRPIT